MAEQKKKDRTSFTGRWQHRYLKNFVKDEKGEWQYRGDHYRYAGSDEEQKRMRKRLLVLAAAAFAGGLGGGLITAPGTLGTWYVILPLALTFLMTGFVLYKSVSLFFARSVLRDYDYKSLVGTAILQNLAAMVLAASAGLAECVYLVLNGAENNAAGAVLFLLCEAAAFGFMRAWRCTMQDAVYVVIHPENENFTEKG